MCLQHIAVCRNDRADPCRSFFGLQDRKVLEDFPATATRDISLTFSAFRAARRTQSFTVVTPDQRNEIIIDDRRQVTHLVRLRSGADTQEFIAEMQRRFQVPNPVTDGQHLAGLPTPCPAQPCEMAFSTRPSRVQNSDAVTTTWSSAARPSTDSLCQAP